MKKLVPYKIKKKNQKKNQKKIKKKSKVNCHCFSNINQKLKDGLLFISTEEIVNVHQQHFSKSNFFFWTIKSIF